MYYLALACDYDGTIATHGKVDRDTIESLRLVRSSGRRLILVTGRHVDDLKNVFPEMSMFDLVVAENGGLLYWPATHDEKLLADSPAQEFIDELERRGVEPLIPGRVVVATTEPCDLIAHEVIETMRLNLHVILNKGAVMILPEGVNKGSGVKAAARELNIPLSAVVGVGDAENDATLLHACGFGAAVENALPIIKEMADFVSTRDHGAGVTELIERLVTTDLRDLKPQLQRHR